MTALLTVLMLWIAPAHAGAYGDPVDLVVDGSLPEAIGDACAADVSPEGDGQLWTAQGCDTGAMTKALGDGSFRMAGEPGVYRLARCEASSVMCPSLAFSLQTWSDKARHKASEPARCRITAVQRGRQVRVESWDACPQELHKDVERFLDGNVASSEGSVDIRQRMTLTVLPARTLPDQRKPRIVVEGHAPRLLHAQAPDYPEDRIDKALDQVDCTFDLGLGKDGTVSTASVRPPADRLQTPCLPPFEAAAREALGAWRWLPPIRNGQAHPARMTLTVRFRR